MKCVKCLSGSTGSRGTFFFTEFLCLLVEALRSKSHYQILWAIYFGLAYEVH